MAKDKKPVKQKLLRKDLLKLIDNLTSGEYQKGEGSLATNWKKGKPTSWCCLGVWADQHGCAWKKLPEYDSLCAVKGNKVFENSSSLENAIRFGIDAEDQRQLMNLNDQNTTFKEVLHYIVDEMLPKAE